MKARIIGAEDELGPFHTLTFFGLSLSREWSEIKATPEQVEKLQGNRFVELREGASRPKPSEAAPIDTVPEIKARLDELGVEYDPRDKKADLAALLELAEAAHAASAAEADPEA